MNGDSLVDGLWALVIRLKWFFIGLDPSVIRTLTVLAIVAAVGDRMRGTPGIAATVFSALGSAGINIIAISQGSSERNISLVVTDRDAGEAVRAIHRAFRLETS